MKVSEVMHLKNKIGRVLIDRMWIDVQIIDIRDRFGGVDYLITPVAGSESTWVASFRVHFNE